jgi:hypothetical protein
MLLLGAAGASAQFFPGPLPYPPVHPHHFPYPPVVRPPVVVQLTVVKRPAPVFVPQPVVVQQPVFVPQPVVPVHRPLIPNDPATQLVAIWYQRYLQRQPDAEGLFTHAQVIATQGEHVALSGILGSDEYFQICGQDPRSWIVSLYINELNRRPDEFEIQNWYQSLAQCGWNRSKTALDFLCAAKRERGR